MADKGISVISHNGEDYNINDPNIAGEFYPNSNYAVGDHVTHEGKLYVFTAAHTGAWTGTDVTQVQIGAELHDYGAHAMVRYDVAQTLTDAQKTVARNNIGAASGSVVSEQGIFLSNLSAAVGTVPTGETVEGQIGDLKSAIGDVPTGKTVQSQIDRISKKQALLHDNVPGTIQTYYFTDGSVSKIEHKSGTEIIRTDVYSYGTSTITETRTLNTGEALTIITNLNTLETSVTYTAA